MPKTLWNKETTNLKNGTNARKNLTLRYHGHAQNRNLDTGYLLQNLGARFNGGSCGNHIVHQKNVFKVMIGTRI